MYLSIVIPCYNEEDNIGPLLESLLELDKSQNFNCEIIVVNDNSSDKTPEIVNNFKKNNTKIKLINRKNGNNGMGFALRIGTEKTNGKFIIWVMGDRSDDIKTIPKILNKLKEGYDMVFGSRYMNGASSGNLSLFKATLSSGFTLTSRFILGIHVHDITNAFRGFRREVYNSVDLKTGDFTISPEFAIKAHKKGFKLGEVPTVYTDRTKGKSKFNILKMGISYSKLLLLKFKKDQQSNFKL